MKIKTKIGILAGYIGCNIGYIFVIIKLFGVGKIATWSWLWILSPFWITISMYTALILLVEFFSIIVIYIIGIDTEIQNQTEID